MSEAEAQTMAPAPEPNELPPPDIQDMINHAMSNEFSHANNIFNDMMTVKLNDVLDQEKVRLADQIFNGGEDESVEVDQLELDLETESESEEGEQGEAEADEIEEEEMTDEEIDDIIDNLSDEELAELEAEIESEEDENSSE